MKYVRVCGHSFVLDFLQEGGLILDCGTNQGEFSTWILKHLPRVKVCGFEPDPRLFPVLPDLPNFQKVKKAITGDGMEVTLRLGEGRCSSIHYKEAENQELVKASSITLDEFCRAEGIEKIDLVKLDIEGAEIDVLENISSQLLGRIGQITIEFHDFLRRSDLANIKHCINRLEETGFYCIKFSWSDHSDLLFINTQIYHIGWVARLHLVIIKYKYGIMRRMISMLKKKWD